MRISDWSSDVCSSDLILPCPYSATLLSAAPTLADVIAAVLASELKSETAKRIAGDIRIVAGWLDRDPADIPAHPGVLRQKPPAPPQDRRAPCRERVCPYV